MSGSTSASSAAGCRVDLPGCGAVRRPDVVAARRRFAASNLPTSPCESSPVPDRWRPKPARRRHSRSHRTEKAGSSRTWSRLAGNSPPFVKVRGKSDRARYARKRLPRARSPAAVKPRGGSSIPLSMTARLRAPADARRGVVRGGSVPRAFMGRVARSQSGHSCGTGRNGSTAVRPSPPAVESA